MSKVLSAKNEYDIILIDEKEFVEFKTGGKYCYKVIVDKHTWENYLHKYHWTVSVNKSDRKVVKTSINKHSKSLYRLIIENECDIIDYWGNCIDHINNNVFDNRLENLRIYNSKLNCTNIKSKYEEEDMHLIYPQRNKKDGGYITYGYKVHANIFDETVYKSFANLEDAKNYRDTVLQPYINKRIEDMKKMTRDIEFERGLKHKLEYGEKKEILNILEKYGLRCLD